MKAAYLRLYNAAAWVFMTASLVYLIHTIYTHQSLPALIHHFSAVSLKSIPWIILVIILLPLNLLLETLKWKYTLKHTETISTGQAFRSILSGMASGFMTPNRIGDIFGRILYLKPENLKAGLTLSTLTSLTKNLAILIPGMPAAFYFFITTGTETPASPASLIATYLISFVVITGLLLLFPVLARSISKPGITQYLRGIKNFRTGELLAITGISAGRVVVFSFQLWLMLRYFGADPGLTATLTTIPASWLFITFTPSLAITEGVVRSSWAMFFIGHYTAYHPGVMLAGASLWFINVVIPVLWGSYYFMKGKRGMVNPKAPDKSSTVVF